MDEKTGELPPNFVSMVLGLLEHDDVARAEFLDGLDKCMHRLSIEPTQANTDELLRFTRRWAMSVLFEHVPERRAALEEAERRIAAGDLGDPVPTEDLRTALRG